ncbi:MAG TPA: uroporphyrinogen-III synthase [Burkholderiaceae bacterium]|nr:uroporphyrinogen-III synthase [Burkholderiaceae bacterium]
MIIIVTRPASAGQRLFERIVDHGHPVLWWPAFDIGAAPDAERATATLARLADYDLAIFVSVHAVRAAQSLLTGAWPTGTMIGAVGATTRAAVESSFTTASSVVVSSPDNDRQSGSEAFWAAWQATKQRAQRVLIARAEGGRDWLAERFEEQGARVEAVAVYSRRVRCPSSDELQRLDQLAASNEQPVTVFSSTEAVPALDSQIEPAVRAWLRRGVAIASHPRIAAHLSSSGYARVLNATFDDDSIVAQLESIGSERQAPT